MTDLPVWIMLGLGLVGIIAIIIWMAFLTQNKDNGAEIQKNLAIVAGVTGILIGIFAAAAYIYFTANTNYLTPFLLVMTFINLFLSLFATSASTLQLVKS
jgi:high-affinity Fe2+/Pb2+ permease